MSEISTEIGKNIRNYRKKRGMTLEDLSRKICKGKSTLSKYEKGEIIVDIETLYELADILQVHIAQLLYTPPLPSSVPVRRRNATFFRDVRQFYSYLYDGRTKQLMRCVFDIVDAADEDRQGVMMYMNFRDYDNYRNAETIYYGYIEHFDSLTNIMLTNQDSPIEKASAHILASYQSADTKWGLFNGISSRPLMPIAAKMLFSKARLKEDDDLLERLKVSREDIRILRMYNMMAIT